MVGEEEDEDPVDREDMEPPVLDGVVDNAPETLEASFKGAVFLVASLSTPK